MEFSILPVISYFAGIIIGLIIRQGLLSLPYNLTTRGKVFLTVMLLKTNRSILSFR